MGGRNRMRVLGRGRSRGHARRCSFALAWAMLLVAGSGEALAEVQRVEAVGIYGIRDSMRTKVIPRDEAIADARWEAVSRVALELIGESGAVVVDEELDAFDEIVDALPRAGSEIEGPLEAAERGARVADPDDVRLGRDGPSEDETALLRAGLGKDMLPYTRSYRILEDQGERPVLFDDAPGIDTEYVVVIEVIVDVDRVGRALEDAGLVVSADAENEQIDLTVELVGLSRYPALERVLAAFRGPLGATRVSMLEFERGRQLFEVEGPFDAESLAAKIADLREEGLDLAPVALDPVFRRIRVQALWFPPAETALEGAGR